MKFVFINDFFVVVDKPSAVLTVPSRFSADDKRTVLGRRIEEELGQRIYPVHRLDFEVSGLVLFARTAESHKSANDAFENRLVKKRYQALSEGSPESLEEKEYIWESRLLKGKKRTFISPHGKPSLTKATFCGLTSEKQLKWDLEPVTGRSHQLRFELYHHGFPILGDVLYGAQQNWSQPGIALRSYNLDFRKTELPKRWQMPESIQIPAFFETSR